MRTPDVLSCWATGGRSLRTATVTASIRGVGREHGGGEVLGQRLEEGVARGR